MKKEHYSYKKLQRYAGKLGKKIPGGDYDYIVAVTRGGLLLALQLSYILDIKKILTFGIESYEGTEQKGITELVVPQEKLVGAWILLVDDLMDTGETMAHVKKRLAAFGAEHCDMATYFYKPNSILMPEYFVKQTDKWVVFPYEKSN